MSMDQKQPTTMSLKQVLDAADRASEQVSSWPKWKQELSAPRSEPVTPSTSTNKTKS